jgi:hypothetical protein
MARATNWRHLFGNSCRAAGKVLPPINYKPPGSAHARQWSERNGCRNGVLDGEAGEFSLSETSEP